MKTIEQIEWIATVVVKTIEQIEWSATVVVMTIAASQICFWESGMHAFESLNSFTTISVLLVWCGLLPGVGC